MDHDLSLKIGHSGSRSASSKKKSQTLIALVESPFFLKKKKNLKLEVLALGAIFLPIYMTIQMQMSFGFVV